MNNSWRGNNADNPVVTGVGRVFDPDFAVGELLKLLDDGTGSSDEPTDAGRMTKQAEGYMA